MSATSTSDHTGPSPDHTGPASGGAAPTDRPTTGLPFEVDWTAAARWGGRLASPGPTGSRGELEHLVAELHDAGRRARPLAMRAARLGLAVEAAGRTESHAQVLVVDRPGWARAATESFAAMTGPVQAADRPGTPRRTAPLDRVRAATTPLRTGPVTAEVAALLSLLAGRVLGQFDPFAAGAPPSGRLLLVAPNLLRTERALAAEPSDFRLWVAVHEQTHALQFAAAPWLAEHLRSEVAALIGELAGASPGGEIADLVAAVVRSLRSTPIRRAGRGGAPDGPPAPDDRDGLGLLGAVLDEAQRARMDRITAVMSLLEGHADVAMDAVGVGTIPSVRRLRSRFEARRRTATGADKVLRRLLGMDAKLAQYRRGAAFVRAVRRSGGRNALDAVWTGVEQLPTAREIADPRAWVRRVHG